MSIPFVVVDGVPFTQHCKSDGPTQYPAYDFPPSEEHDDVCIQVPDPDGVEQAGFVQHLTSEDPEQRFDVT